MSADDDRQLVDRCIARAPGAWRIFVDRFAPTVRALASRYLKLNGQFPDSAELDDVTQDVFMALIHRDYHLLKNYDPTFSFKTYLGVITRTEVHRMLRKRRRMGGRIEDLESEPSREAGVEVQVEQAVVQSRFQLFPARATTMSKLGMTTIRLSYNPHDQ